MQLFRQQLLHIHIHLPVSTYLAVCLSVWLRMIYRFVCLTAYCILYYWSIHLSIHLIYQLIYPSNLIYVSISPYLSIFIYHFSSAMLCPLQHLHPLQPTRAFQATAKRWVTHVIPGWTWASVNGNSIDIFISYNRGSPSHHGFQVSILPLFNFGWFRILGKSRWLCPKYPVPTMICWASATSTNEPGSH